MLGQISIIMDKIKTENIPVVIDADGLWHLTNNPLIIKGYRLGHSPIFLLLISFPKRFPRWKQPSLNWQICRHTPTNIYTQGLKTGFLSVAQDTELLIQTVTDGMYRPQSLHCSVNAWTQYNWRTFTSVCSLQCSAVPLPQSDEAESVRMSEHGLVCLLIKYTTSPTALPGTHYTDNRSVKLTANTSWYLSCQISLGTSLGKYLSWHLVQFILHISIQWIYWHRKQWTMYVQWVIGQDIGLGGACGGGGTNLFSGSSPLLLLAAALPYLLNTLFCAHTVNVVNNLPHHSS